MENHLRNHPKGQIYAVSAVEIASLIRTPLPPPMADSSAPVVSAAEARQEQHPLSQITASRTHRLLLKQWVKEEDLLAHCVALREAHLDASSTAPYLPSTLPPSSSSSSPPPVQPRPRRAGSAADFLAIGGRGEVRLFGR
jgi:hypothetical protein